VRSRVGLHVAGMSLVVAACSGSAATPAPSAAPPTLGLQSAAPTAAPASAAPTVAPATAAPTPAPTQEPTAAPSEVPSGAATASALPSLDFSDITKNLSHLTSYHETFDQTGGAHDLHAEVVIVRAPKLEESVVTADQRLVIIGTDTYVDTGTGKFVKNMVPPAALQGEFDAFDPGVFLRSFQKAVDFAAVPVVGVETKNGVQAVHFHADSSTSLGPGKPTIPPGAVFDLWVSSDNDYLVALEYSGVQENGKLTSGSIELTNVNDPSLSVPVPT
jgi:hypothetical protein